MLSDISIGQYFPGNSLIHELDPRIKIILSTALIVLIFLVNNVVSFALVALIILWTILISKVPVAAVWKGVKPVLPLVIFTAIINLFFVTGTPVFHWGILTITSQGIRLSIVMAIRIILLIAGASMLTYTTSPIALTDALERLFKPLQKVHFPVHEMAMMMTIALRFIPTLLVETDKIMSAQKARGADLETGGLTKRAKALLPILIPLFVSAFRRAEELALAMESRCYRGGEGRTRMKQLVLTKNDFQVSAVFTLLFAVAVLLNSFVPSLF